MSFSFMNAMRSIIVGDFSRSRASDYGNLPIHSQATDLFQFALIRQRGEELVARRKRSAGPDEIVLASLPKGQRNVIYNALEDAIQDESYLSSPGRVIEIPKRNGGFREITIQNVVDTLAASLVLVFLRRHIDPSFKSMSFGGRHGKSVHQLLASFSRDTTETGRYVLLELDVRKAFDNVRINLLFQLINRLDLSRSMARLVKAIILAGRPYRHDLKGIPQGNPLSMLLMNLYLHHALDNAIELYGITYRYADNLIMVLNSKSESPLFRSKLEKRIRKAGLSFNSPQLVDLNQARAQLFDLPVSVRNGGIEFDLPEDFWLTLQEQLDLCGKADNPSVAARGQIRAIFSYFRPCLSEEQLAEYLSRLQEALANANLKNDLNLEEFSLFYRGLISQWQTEVQNADRIATGPQTIAPGGASHPTNFFKIFRVSDFLLRILLLRLARRPHRSQRPFMINGLLILPPIRGPP